MRGALVRLSYQEEAGAEDSSLMNRSDPSACDGRGRGFRGKAYSMQHKKKWNGEASPADVAHQVACLGADGWRGLDTLIIRQRGKVRKAANAYRQKKCSQYMWG